MPATLTYAKAAPRKLVSAPRKSSTIFIIIILAFAGLLRLCHINQPYIDLAAWRETSTVMMADNFYHRNSNILYPEISWNGLGETYNGRELQTVSYISSLLYRVVGQHDWVGRLVSALFGLWGIFALYKLVQRIWDEAHARLAAVIISILPGAVYLDRTFLPDPAMVSLTTTGVWMYVAYLQTSRIKYLTLAVAFACWGFLSKITGMLVLLPMLYATIAVLRSRGQLNLYRISTISGAGLLVFAIVVSYYLWARYLSLNYPPYHFAGAGNWVLNDGILSWLQQRYFLPPTLGIFMNWTLGIPFLVLFIAGIFTSIKMTRFHLATTFSGAPYFFHYWLLGCCVFYIIGAKELVHNFWNFHIWHPMIAAFSASALLAIWSILKQRQEWLRPIYMLLFLVLITVSNRHVLRNTFTGKYYLPDYQMGAHLASLRQPEDLVVVAPRELGNPIAIYYSGGRGWVFPPAGKERWDMLPESSDACISTLENLRKQGAKWFGIYRKQYEHIRNAYSRFAQHLEQQYQIVADHSEYVIFRL